MRPLIFFVALISAFNASANGFTAICGNFTMVAEEGKLSKINGERVTSQRITELGRTGLKVDMGLMPASDGNNYGFQYIHPDSSDQRWLNVQLLQSSMDAPRIIGTFDCVKK